MNTFPQSHQQAGPPAGPGVRGEIAALFARALDGDDAAELELGRRAFPWMPGGIGGPSELDALRAHLALTRAGYEHYLRTPRSVQASGERDTGARDARARDAFAARVAAMVDARCGDDGTS